MDFRFRADLSDDDLHESDDPFPGLLLGLYVLPPDPRAPMRPARPSAQIKLKDRRFAALQRHLFTFVNWRRWSAYL
jgi:hypothetical protein